MIGAIGSKTLDDVIIFESTDKRLLTFIDFARKNSVRFSKNDVLLKKPVSQYIGPDLDVISFKIELKAQYGVNPRDEMDKLIQLHRDGEAVTLVVGKKAFGAFRWRVAELNMAWERVDNKGVLTAASCEIALEEYV